MLPGLHSTWPRNTSSRFNPRSSTPTLSPAWPISSDLRNISTPVHVDLEVAWMPTNSTSSPGLTTPVSMRPDTTVPRPEMLNTSSTGSKNGRSKSRTGSGMYSSTCFIRSRIAALPRGESVPWTACNADPRTTGMSSPGKSYESSNSRISISTNSSNSSSSTMSTLFKNTTNAGTPTWRDSKMCSRV
ncbi:hypothetical protein H257_09178 [Aphanomyces astaci]|uniref:Uncharacterized protein n=1 Tax=Aphanomyces astaci TaxID=112090 RepID=W4GAI8_APHAT|nr:hypothetical protein H257_09178 [Aphanomyces astaci]ETV76702.1 hypothetical protein H257_09178 [Aphanomyces astaci]|eukprot:XP_009833614.1 hypothetical protein H257_09178 [Aphanomyces astaci]